MAELGSGRVRLLGEEIGGLPSRLIARRGVSRTFQHVKMLPEMSVLENVALAATCAATRASLRSVAGLAAEGGAPPLPPRPRRQLERVGLREQMHEPAGSLALGQARLMEIARALCADRVLLLDRAAAGLRHQEKQSLGRVLRQLRARA